jgi:hypothetical protein
MSAQVLAGAVVAHRGAWIGVAGGDLYVAKADAGVQHGRDEGVAQHVRVHPRHPNSGRLSQVLESTGGRVPVYSGAEGVAQDRTGRAVIDCPVDGSGHRGRQWDEDDLAAFAADPQDAVAVFLAEVGDACAARLEDP